MAYPFDAILRPLLVTAQISSWQQLATTSGIPVSRLRQLRRGQIAAWKISELQKLSLALQISCESLLQKLEIIHNTGAPQITDFQYASFQIMESYLTYWPAAAHQAKLDPSFPASKLLPLAGSIDRLIASWGIQSIGQVGEIIPFNPQEHQSLDGSIPPSTPVYIRYPGYRQSNDHGTDRLLIRAKVSPLPADLSK